MKRRIRKELKFECGHQLRSAECGLCRDTVHGHSYRVELILELHPDRVEKYSEHDMVVDFGSREMLTVKAMVDEYYDHALLMPSKAPDGVPQNVWDSYIQMLARFNVKLRIWDVNPTAEEIAKKIFCLVQNIFSEEKSQAVITKIIVHETATGYAEYSVK